MYVFLLFILFPCYSLISGNILRDSNNPTVTNNMCRFQKYNSSTLGWEITNHSKKWNEMSLNSVLEENNYNVKPPFTLSIQQCVLPIQSLLYIKRGIKGM